MTYCKRILAWLVFLAGLLGLLLLASRICIPKNNDSLSGMEQARANGASDWKGTYDFKLPRDNRWGYGLAGGGGIAFLIRRFELNFRVRYYFGYSDIVRNRNKYYDNNSDGAENPFWATPLRSPLDNLMISVGLNYRFNKQGFEAWKPRPKKEKNREVFKFGL